MSAKPFLKASGIGKKKSPEWLCREFILSYFGSKTSASQKEYRKFVQSLVEQETEEKSPDHRKEASNCEFQDPLCFAQTERCHIWMFTILWMISSVL